MEILKQIEEYGIVPVVVLDDPKDALPLAKALYDGGLLCAEITFRTEAAEECIKLISNEYPEMLIGAGTVITTDQVDRAVNAGAKFIVSPGFDIEIVDYCINNNIIVFPGCVTPSDVMQAVKRGLTVLKFFPSEQFGGLDMINALCGPFPNVKFIPTGGINTNNLDGYLSSKHVIACGGTWMVKKELVQDGRFEEITQITKKAKLLVTQIRGA